MTPWLSGWKYRKSLCANYSVDGAQTDYQLLLTINRVAAVADETPSGPAVDIPAAHSLANFNDLRFTGRYSFIAGNNNAVSGTYSDACNYVVYHKCTAAAGSTATGIRVYCVLDSSIKAAIYSDNGSGTAPGARLSANDIGVACAANAFTIVPIPPLSMITGTVYWIATNTSINGAFANATPTGGYRCYKAASYETYVFPPLAESGLAGPDAYSGCCSAVGEPSVLPHWIEEYTADRARVWVSFDYIPAGPASAYFYMYYGNPSASTGSVYFDATEHDPIIGVWGVEETTHIVLEAAYLLASQEINRAFVIGQDISGNEVSGMSAAGEESALVGERLDVRHVPAATSAAQAGYVAQNVLARARLDSAGGRITIPPHCGLELWDVLNFSDLPANQAASFRVAGYTLEYDARKGVYRQTIDLCGV